MLCARKKPWVGTMLTWLVAAAAIGCGSSSAEPDAGDDGSCGGGNVVETRADCYQDVSCVELPDGRYCSGGGAETCPPGAVSVPHDEPCPADLACWEYSLSLHCAAPKP